jgi:diguanylate cyclase (GGDEF)-like protein
VVIISRDGRVSDMNSAFSALSDIKKDVAIGSDCRDLEPLSSIWNGITGCMLERKGWSERMAFRNMVLDVSITPVEDGSGLTHACILMRDVSHYVNLEEELTRKNKELIIINTLSSTFISSRDMGALYRELLEKVMTTSQMGIGWIALREEDRFVLKGSIGMSSGLSEKAESGELDFLYSDVLSTTDPLFVLEAPQAASVETFREEGIVFIAVIPLRVGEEAIGVLALASRMEVKFDFDVASLFSLTGNTLSLIAEKIKLFQETRRLATLDSLTGIYNVRHFYEILAAEMARTARYSTPFSLTLFDIDNFKLVNDTFGHQAGDGVLVSIAEAMMKTARQTDSVARYGGEEFIVVLPNTSKEEAYNLSIRIKDAVERLEYPELGSLKITLSGGVASFPDDAGDSKSLLYAADMAMYKAKEAGKKCVRMYEK